MNTLLEKLERLKVTGNCSDSVLWSEYGELLQRTLVPQKLIGKDRPCEERDYREYRQVVDRNLKNVNVIVQHILQCQKHSDCHNDESHQFVVHLILIIGEQHEKNIWNTAESVLTAEALKIGFCRLFNCESISDFLKTNDNLLDLILVQELRPKLLKDTWKSYPAAVSCYKWLLHCLKRPQLENHISQILPTSLMLLDDYIPENVLIGLNCIRIILEHTYERKEESIDLRYAKVIFHALERLTREREPRYVVKLYSCLDIVLRAMESSSEAVYSYMQWTERDEILESLLINMEMEQSLDLRHAYIVSLRTLLADFSCLKWMEFIIRILGNYCEHHTDLKTLKETLETAKTILRDFNERVPAHCVSLYTMFLKLHVDLIQTPTFDGEIMQNLEDCICLLYKLTPAVGSRIIQDKRMQSIITDRLQVLCLGGIKYIN